MSFLRLGLRLLGAATLLTGTAASGAVTPANLFQDGMVLQSGVKVPVWGRADPGEQVTVRFGSQSRLATTGADGKWLVALDALPTNSLPADLTISGSTEVTLKNVVVGEVWLASGQSNMQFSVNETMNRDQEIAAANYPLIRCFTVAPGGSLTPVEDGKGAWHVCTPQAVGRFSAVAFFFARALQHTLHVPIGIIDSSYGGTPAEAWTSRAAMDSVPEFKQLADRQIAAMETAPVDAARFPVDLSAWEDKSGVEDSENRGFRDGWAAVDADPADWKPANAPFTWESALGAKSGGAFWLRKEVDLPESAAGKSFDLKFGRLSEQYHTVYFNGEQVGEMGHTPPNFYSGDRSASVPGRLVRAGKNVIAIRFVSHTEKGGFQALGKTLNLPVANPADTGDAWLVRSERLFPSLPPGALDSRPHFIPPIMQYTSTTLFNQMITPLIPGAIRGVIWYQGEANVSTQGAGSYYRRLLSLMIGDWRARWREGDFPFYLVQLANYSTVDRSHRTNPWSWLRESQTWISRNVPHSGLAVTIDLGSATTIHPTDKQDVGERLALVALARDYGSRDLIYESPLYKDCSIEGDKVRVRFEPGSGNLMIGEKHGLEPVREVPAGKLTWFEIAGEDKKFAWADASIEGDSVVVSCPEVPHPVAVRYAWAENPEGCNLYSRAGLPASPFRTDDWP